MWSLWQDLRFGARVLTKNRGLTVAIVMTLALGVGANSGIFSVFDAALLRPLPVKEPDRLVNFQIEESGGFDTSFNYPLYTDYRDNNTVLEGLAAYGSAAFSLTAFGESERVLGTIVSGNFFDVLGVRPSPGRGFLPEEDRSQRTHPVAVLSHGLWQRRFGGDPGLVGRDIILNGHSFTVIGITPRGFTGVMRGFSSDVYVPMMMYSAVNPGRSGDPISERTFTWLQMIGRMKPDLTREQVQSAMRMLATQIAEVQPINTRTEIVVTDGSRGFTGLVDDLLAPLTILQVIVGLVLLIACANVANLLLARALTRRREMAIRMVLGAGGRRLLRQLLSESLLLASLGGLAGLLVAPWVVELLLRFRPWPSFALETGLDFRVLGFSLIVTLLTGIIFGLAPALQAGRSNLVTALKDENLRFGRATRFNLRGALVITQLALSVAVLVAAGLSLRSLYHLYAIPSGFDAEKVLMMSVDLGRAGYTEERGRRFFFDVLERVRALPGIEAAGMAEMAPLSGAGMRVTSQPEGHLSTPEKPINITFNVITPGWLQAMGILLKGGREFTWQDSPDAAPVIMVNEALVAHYWPGEDGLGKRIEVPGGPGKPRRTAEVVGVVENSRYRSLTEPMIPTMYVPFEQDYNSSGVLFLRARSDPTGLIDAARGAVRELDSGLPVFGIRTLAEQRNASLANPRLAATLLSLLGAVALLLASLGMYGVLAYSVARSTREIGVRVALGARPQDIFGLVLRRGMLQVGAGLLFGIGGALAAVRLLDALLYDIGPYDPATFLAVAVVIIGVALLACYIPARRATRVDPMTALRHE